MKNNQCPKFNTCNAPICPLDKEWRKRIHQREDSTCYYMIESVKDNAKTNFEGALLGELYQVIVTVRDDISKHFKRIGKKLEAAAKTPSRMQKNFKSIKEIV